MSLQLKYPSFAVKVKNDDGKTKIFDPIRKKWFVLTPEEWVRQHVLNYLIEVKKYPASLISVEKEIALNNLKKRYDIVIYKRDLNPFLIVECKAPFVSLDISTIEQAQRYNLMLRANYLMITNGITDLILNSENKNVDLPNYF
ncbi:MAG: type I restriction enzyme HsdR N-terminal domain-containing protein [Bacteroidota bacterium]|nr:type I restriction enzyme HsdR N-terminal domain-containing protein [Bacteroidota bacterium]